MAKENRQDYQKTLMEFLSCRPVAYWPALARRVGGVKAAVLLSQLLYWNGDEGVKARGGWIYLSVSDLEEQTGLTKVEQQTARLTLQELGVVDSCLRGMPRIWQYKVNLEVLGQLLLVTNIGKESHSMRNLPNIGKVSHPTLGRNPAQLNKVLKTTEDKTTEDKTTSSSYLLHDDKKQEEEVSVSVPMGDRWKERVKDHLREIEVFENLYDEIFKAGWSEEELCSLADQVKADQSITNPAGVFIHRIRQGQKPKGTKPVSKNYLSGPYADYIKH